MTDSFWRSAIATGALIAPRRWRRRSRFLVSHACILTVAAIVAGLLLCAG